MLSQVRLFTLNKAGRFLKLEYLGITGFLFPLHSYLVLENVV